MKRYVSAAVMSTRMGGLFFKRPALRSCISVGLFLTGLLFARTVAAGPPIIVGDGAPTACTEAALKDALFIASVRGGGRIRFNCGDAPATLTVSPLAEGEPFGSVAFTIPDHTTIDGSDLITVQGAGGKTTMLIPANATVSLKGISLTNATLAPAIINQGTLTLSDTLIAHNGDADDLDIFTTTVIHNFGTLVVHDSTLSDNLAGFGVLFNDGGTLIVSRSAFLGNLGVVRGSIINGGTADVTHSVFSGNVNQDGKGGGIFNDGVLTVEHCEFSSNVAFEGGGAIFNGNQTAPGTLLVIASTFSNNGSSALPGGGAISGSALIERSQFVGNTSGVSGGALAGGSFIIRNSLFTENTADFLGGAIAADEATLTRSTITGNTAGTDGGGIISGSPPVLIHTSVTDNTPNDISTFSSE